MKMKKINMDKVKEFFFDHGEKVGLGVCIFIALLLGLLGIVRARSSGIEEKTGKPFKEFFASEKDRIKREIDSRTPEEPPPELQNKLLPEAYTWDYKDLRYSPALYTHVTEEASGSKRDRPTVFPVREGVKPQYWQGLVLTHELTENRGAVKTLVGAADGGGGIGIVRPPFPGGQMVGGPQLPFLRAAEARRMVFGTMVFPMKAQVAEFVRALKMKDQTELFQNREDLPRPLGFTLVRVETAPDGRVPKNPKVDVLVEFRPKDMTKPAPVAASVAQYMKQTMFDEKLAELLEPYVWNGFTMPSPQIAYGELPRFELADIKIDWSMLADPKKPVGPGMKTPTKEQPKIFTFPKKRPLEPMPPMGKEPEAPVADGKVEELPKRELAKAAPQLAARLFDSKFNVFHILGEPLPLTTGAPAGNKGIFQPPPQMIPGQAGAGKYIDAWEVKPKELGDPNQPMFPPPVRPEQPMGGQTGGPERPDWDRDAIVRFVDPEVEPGKTYVYQIQVYLANPNYKKPNNLVAFDNLTVDPVLPASAWAKTDPVTIPTEYWMYAVDQQLLDEWSNPLAKPSPDAKPVPKDATTFQIHQWLKKRENFANPDEYIIGDWVVAERLIVRKGEYIGAGAVIQAPVWRKLRDGFEVPMPHKEVGKDKRPILSRSGIKLDLTPPSPEGDNARAATLPPVLVDFYGGKRYLPKDRDGEDVAVEALIMTSDGQLMIYNSREHADIRDRQRRVIETRDRIDEVRANPGVGPGGGGFRPPGAGANGS